MDVFGGCGFIAMSRRFKEQMSNLLPSFAHFRVA
jgi:hypothetical protein